MGNKSRRLQLYWLPWQPRLYSRPSWELQLVAWCGYKTKQYFKVGCKELRSKRYISDGFCTSLKPITEVVCTGHCLPIRDLPWYAEFIKVWSRNKIMEYRCVNDEVKRRRVHLSCDNGETRTYKIKVVKSCKCKKYMRLQNESRKTWATNVEEGDLQKRRRRKNKKNKSDPPRPANTAEL